MCSVKEIVRNRRYTYGEPITSYKNIAKKWSATLGAEVTAEQVILCMIDLKTLRFQRDKDKQKDSAYDIAGYSALLANFFNKGD